MQGTFLVELVVFIGLPGAGKSSFYRAHLAATHGLVSKDLLPRGDRGARRLALVDEALRAGRSVAVDNTHVTRESRVDLIALGHARGARVIALWFDVPVAECLARNRGREGRARVPDVAIHAFARRLEPPVAAEGFDEIRKLVG